jgi:hypothetical protein
MGKHPYCVGFAQVVLQAFDVATKAENQYQIIALIFFSP